MLYTYAKLHEYVVLKLTGDMRKLTCRLSDWRSDRSSLTCEYNVETRASRDAIAPVDGTILDACT